MKTDKQLRKQKAREYVQTHRPMGIYQIKNKVNGKLFIGRSLNLDAIFNRHQFTLNYGVNTNKELQREWKEYGEANFSFDVLQYIKPREEILESSHDLVKYEAELEEL